MNIDNIGSQNFGSTEQPTAGKVNFNTSAANDYITNEAFKTLRSNLLFCGPNIKTIVVTSSNENEGKTSISTELAKGLAEIDKKTLLIDADMRKSVILRRNLKTQNIMGLSELLSNQATVSQVVYNTQNPNFDVIFSGHFPPNPVELLNSEQFKNVLEGFQKIYDYIIIDTPPLFPVIDAAVIASYCDGVILIVSPGKVKINQAVAVKEQLTKSGCKILGAIINETDYKRQGFGKQNKNSYYETENSRFSSKKR